MEDGKVRLGGSVSSARKNSRVRLKGRAVLCKRLQIGRRSVVSTWYCGRSAMAAAGVATPRTHHTTRVATRQGCG